MREGNVPGNSNDGINKGKTKERKEKNKPGTKQRRQYLKITFIECSIPGFEYSECY